jgi:hypothetical protein
MPFRNGNNPANKKNLDEELIRELYRSGLSTNKISQRLGCHKSLIVQVIRKHNELRYQRLSPEERSKALTLYRSGLSGPVIAQQMGVANPAVYHALKKHGVAARSLSDYSYEEPLRHDFFHRIDTPEKAYWLGMLITDGCVSKENEIILSLAGDDIVHVERWRNTIQSTAKLSNRTWLKTFGKYEWVCSSSRVTIRSRQLAAALAKLGVTPAKTGRTTYPDGSIPEHLERHFWRGAIDGDGWLCWGQSGERRQFVIGFTGDEPLVRAFQDFCRKHVPTRAAISSNGNAVVKLTLTDWFGFGIAQVCYEGEELALARKAKIFQDAKAAFAGRVRPPRSWPPIPGGDKSTT